jgi:hypothetical protein
MRVISLGVLLFVVKLLVIYYVCKYYIPPLYIRRATACIIAIS